VHSVGLWHGVLAFAIGLMLGLSLDGVPAPAMEEETAPAHVGTAPAADEPVAAERHYADQPRPANDPPTPAAETPAEETTQTHTRTRIPSR
jgi:hypothetical protein